MSTGDMERKSVWDTVEPPNPLSLAMESAESENEGVHEADRDCRVIPTTGVLLLGVGRGGVVVVMAVRSEESCCDC